MPTPVEIINMVASLQNDTAKSVYKDDAVLPYLNIALNELQEIMEENNIPTTNEVSAIFTVPSSTSVTLIGFSTAPALPANLIEIQQLWESSDQGNSWNPMVRKEFIPHNLDTTQMGNFGIWGWIDQKIYLPPATMPIQVKLDYIKSIFATPILIQNVGNDLGIQYKNILTYLGYATGALCSMFIGADETRAAALSEKADQALERSLNIPIKGRQMIATRRRPFRASYKTRGWY